ncbi:zinc finger CCCH domain-containing protein 6 isoform X1 [Populus trichocarpa]|uniref:zinc finger CCCH domain-containing protein 6 isoform X1 n=1 Tax=Populus trichocarpa TaxID=3694 RepID=UPI00227754B1|nr:zinc finger CCCH domain-containing protein 6 isoform X1 [Populus trichocarpa]
MKKKKGCSKLELHVFAEVGQHQLRMVEKGECIRGAYDVEAYTVLNMLFLGDQTVKVVTKSTKCMLTMVRLFLSEESPSQIGSGAQDHLQAKSSWPTHSAGTDDFLPPGFEGSHPSSQLQIKLSEVPVIKWRCPPRLVLNLTWQLVAGEESEEMEVQNQREMRVLEAVYPRPSAIPPNSTFSVDLESSQHGDHQIPLIPITPIEDEDATEAPSDVMGPSMVPMNSQAQLLASGFPSFQNGIPSFPNGKPTAGVLPGVEPDAMAAVNKSSEQGSLIDPDLLLKILSNPKLIEKLVTDHGAVANAQNIPNTPLSDPLTSHVTLPNPAHIQMNRTESSAQASLTATSSGSFYTQPNGVPMGVPSSARIPPPGVPSTPTGATQAKDINYYKNLIQQHGGDKQETPQQFGSRYNHQVGTSQDLVNSKSRESKHKIMKPCIYFNSSRGCRNGVNCAYQHDSSSQQKGSGITEVQSSKRMKMDREISS